ncbi:GIY-YIG nuclease family protein [Lachnobacterium bovis]|uniref:GIY-YIG nuclease family protein n=1 Tax=Lachnobacterium bovis TaxID=140626 RepID=UPI0003B608BD|nr:GIY-YIG nuclease family protein [Lachnobacterium bovis]
MDNYKYSGMKLFPAVFKELLVLLFDGKQFTRQIAIKNITDYHLEHGGIIEEGRDVVSIFKKATQNLQKTDAGLVNKGYGTWELHYKVQDTTDVVEDIKAETIKYTVDETLGTGSNAVYVYYYDVYKQLAENKGNEGWPCKIGRTDRDPIQRVMGQAGTSYPELPHVALIIYCDDSSALEVALHSILKYQGKWLKNAPGTEWFLTSPKEIKEYYSMLNN